MRILLAIAVALALTGCAQRYKMTLTNAATITTASKPKLNKEGTAYFYKDLQGRETSVSAGRVVEIAPE